MTKLTIPNGDTIFRGYGASCILRLNGYERLIFDVCLCCHVLSAFLAVLAAVRYNIFTIKYLDYYLNY